MRELWVNVEAFDEQLKDFDASLKDFDIDRIVLRPKANVYVGHKEASVRYGEIIIKLAYSDYVTDNSITDLLSEIELVTKKAKVLYEAERSSSDYKEFLRLKSIYEK